MTLALVALLLASPSPKSDFGTAVFAHQRLRNASVTGTIVQTYSKQGTNTRFDLHYLQPDRILLRLQESAQPQTAASDRSYFLDQNRFVAYDRIANEVLRRPGPTRGTLGERLREVLNDYPDAIGVLIDSEVLKTFFSNFENLDGWKNERSQTFNTWRREVGSPGGRIAATFRFDARTALLREVRMDGPQMTLRWTYAYTTQERAPSSNPPADARIVQAFTARPVPPTYATAAARSTVERSVSAHARLQHAEIAATLAGERPVRISISGGRIAERRPDGDWSFDGRTLTYRTRSGQLFRGNSSGADVGARLSRAGIGIDPISLQTTQRRNPVDALLAPDLTVRTLAAGRVDGQMCDAVEMKASGVVISLYVRRADALIAKVSSRNADARGRTVATMNRSYRYETVGQPLPAATFELVREGERPSALPPLQK
jgi:hypothetical protein